MLLVHLMSIFNNYSEEYITPFKLQSTGYSKLVHFKETHIADCCLVILQLLFELKVNCNVMSFIGEWEEAGGGAITSLPYKRWGPKELLQ